MTNLHVKHLHRALAAGLLLLAAVCTGRADPDPQTILMHARMAQTGQQRTFTGHLRLASTGDIIPFTLVLRDNVITYQFKNESITLRMGEHDSALFESANGSTGKVSPARYDKPVEGTDITYEDVSLKFLYWPVAKIVGSETVDELNCWKLQLAPGGQPSAYASMLLWVSKRTGDFLKGEAYDSAGRLVKRFEVRSGQRDPQGGWMLKQMKIETMKQGEDESETYLEIDKSQPQI